MTVPREGSPEPKSSGAASVWRRWVKYAGIVGAVLFLLLLSLALLVTILFPSELVRKELEVRMSEMLQGEVKIQALAFNVLEGLELQGVRISKNDQPLVALERLVLDYRLWELLQRRLSVHEVRLDGADVSLNLPRLRDATTSPEPPSTTESTRTEIPVLPLAVDLRSFVVSHANLSVVVSEGLSIGLQDLNVGIAASLAEGILNLDGSIQVSQVEALSLGRHLQLPLKLDFSVLADLSGQQLMVKVVTVAVPAALSLTASGEVTNFLGDPSVDLTLTDSQVDLGQVRELVKEFIPADSPEIFVTGQVTPGVVVKGSMTPTGFQGLVNVDLALRRLTLSIPRLEAMLASTDVTVKVSDLAVQDNLPKSASLNLDMAMERADVRGHRIGEVTLRMAGDYFAMGPFSMRMKLMGTPMLPPMGTIGPLTLPVSVEGEVVGNHRLHDLTVKGLAVKLGALMDIQVEGFARPKDDNPQAIQVAVTTNLTPHLESVLSLLPPDLLAGVILKKYGEPDTIRVQAVGTLNPAYVPQTGQATVQAHFRDIHLEQGAHPVDGVLGELHVGVSAEYQSKSNTVSGSVSGTLNLSNVGYGGMVQLKRVGLTLGSSFSGVLSPTSHALVDLRAKDILTLALGDVHYDTPTLQTKIKDLRLSLKTHENLVRRVFSLDELMLSSGSFFRLNAGGHYRQDTQAFQARLEIPTMNVGEVLEQVSGDAVTALQDIHPSGEVEVSLSATGRVPNEKEIRELDFPLRLQSKVVARSVSGVFAQHRVNNASANIGVGFSPGELPIAVVTTDLGVEDIQLAPGFPLKSLAHTKATLDLALKGFDELDIGAMTLSTRGAGFSGKGHVAGIKEFLKPDPSIQAAIGKLFANLHAQVRLGLGEFPQVLGEVGLKGSGTAELGVSLLKKEEGPLTVGVKVGGTDMGLSQDGLRVERVNGQLGVKKRLDWGGHTPARARAFNPTDVLTSLRSIGGQGQQLTVDLLDLGFLTIRNVSTFVDFEEHALKIQKLTMDILGGGVGGDMTLTTGRAFGVTGRFELAHLDLNNLLEQRLKIVGDSLVDATIGMAVFFDETTGVLDLSRTEFNLFVTHIGPKALDRVLVFLDPDGSNPTLVNARSQIKLANPSRVTLGIARGMMSIEILFSEGFVPPIRMDRIPVGKLRNFQAVTDTIPQWEKIRDLMVILGATTYGFDDQGTWVMN